MIRAREFLDAWAHRAHRILDRAQRDPAVSGEHIEWALAYLGDATGFTKIPRSLMGGGAKEAEAA
jgi:hypothetical protein